MRISSSSSSFQMPVPYFSPSASKRIEARSSPVSAFCLTGAAGGALGAIPSAAGFAFDFSEKRESTKAVAAFAMI